MQEGSLLQKGIRCCWMLQTEGDLQYCAFWTLRGSSGTFCTPAVPLSHLTNLTHCRFHHFSSSGGAASTCSSSLHPHTASRSCTTAALPHSAGSPLVISRSSATHHTPSPLFGNAARPPLPVSFISHDRLWHTAAAAVNTCSYYNRQCLLTAGGCYTVFSNK